VTAEPAGEGSGCRFGTVAELLDAVARWTARADGAEFLRWLAQEPPAVREQELERLMGLQRERMATLAAELRQGVKDYQRLQLVRRELEQRRRKAEERCR